jgi:phosphatidylinositol alpha-1,6-mannosyltransferase
MNLLALVTDAFGGSGGIAQYNRDLLAALSKASDRVLVLTRQGHAGRSALPLGIWQREPQGKGRFAFAALCAAARRGPFDAVFCGHLNLAPLAAAIAACHRLPLWLQLHGSEAWGPLSWMHIRAAERAALVTAVSRYTRRRFLGICHIDPSRVRVVPDTVGGQFAPGPKPAHLLDRHDLHGRRVLLTVGRLAAAEREKGHDRVLAALPELDPQIVYLVAGDGDDRPRLADLARRLGIADRVRFAGMVAAEELADYYRAADVFVMPSTQEGFGIVFLEAAASGLRVIGGDRDGGGDALADGALGQMTDPTDSASLAAAIRQALVAPAPDPAIVRRYRFENFARHVGDLTAAHLARIGHA